MELTKRIFGGKQCSWIKSQSKGPQPTDAVPVRELAGRVAGLAGASQRVGGTRSQERSGVGGAGHGEPQRSWQDIARASALLRRGNHCGVSSKGVTCAFVALSGCSVEARPERPGGKQGEEPKGGHSARRWRWRHCLSPDTASVTG